MRKTNMKLLTTTAVCTTINYPGALIAVSTKVPLLLDHIGSLLVCILFGWKYGIVTVFLSSVMNQILFDPFALSSTSMGMLVVFMAGILYEKEYFKELHTIPALLLAVLPGAILDAIIQGYIFGGVTSSGSDVIVRFTISKGVNLTVASLTSQYSMELVDRLISFTVVMTVVKRIKIESVR